MLLHNSPLFRIYFGNADDKLFPSHYLNEPIKQDILHREPFVKLKKVMHLDSLIFLRQMHGAQGCAVDQELVQSFAREGDFLFTKLLQTGLGVMTADCLPIIFYDKVNNVVSVAHAGWRGSVQGVAVRTVERMQQQCNTQVEDLQIFFGPSAKICCYTVAHDFPQHLENYPFAEQVLQLHQGKLFFDLPGFNRLQLEAMGIKKKAFHLDYNICTICDEKFFSYRRQGERAGRQMTVVCLK